MQDYNEEFKDLYMKFIEIKNKFLKEFYFLNENNYRFEINSSKNSENDMIIFVSINTRLTNENSICYTLNFISDNNHLILEVLDDIYDERKFKDKEGVIKSFKEFLFGAFWRDIILHNLIICFKKKNKKFSDLALETLNLKDSNFIKKYDLFSEYLSIKIMPNNDIINLYPKKYSTIDNQQLIMVFRGKEYIFNEFSEFSQFIMSYILEKN